MKLNVYTIFDTATGAYARPFFQISDSQATRSFTDAVTAQDSEFAKHPEDYSLHRIGIFDDNNGKLIPEDRECVATALELIALSQNVNRDKIEALDLKIASQSPGGTA